MSIMIDAAVINDKGRIRSNNEDNYYFNGAYIKREDVDAGSCESRVFQQATQYYAVCDGMGGADAGEDASYRVVSELGTILSRSDPMEAAGSFDREIQVLSNAIYDAARARGIHSGTTLAMLALCDLSAYSVNVGDSRVYLARKGALRQLSIDHSEVQRMISMGVITPEEGRTHPRRHVISQYLGMPSDDARVSATMSKAVVPEAGDWFLLCSDGLTDMVENWEIQSILQKAGTAAAAAKALKDAALSRGGKDNVTVLCLRVMRVSPHSRLRALCRFLAASVLFTASSLGALIYFLLDWLASR